MIARRLVAVAIAVAGLASCTVDLGSNTEEIPAFTAPVVDAADAVSDSVEQSVSTQLQAFRDAGGPQIAVAVINTTGNKSIEDYTIDLAREWGVGDKTRDDGVVILIALEDRTMRIEVGSGVEGDLTDVTAARIVNDVMIPLLRNDDVDGAVQQGAAAVQQVWKGQGVPAPTVPMDLTTPSTDWVGSIFFVLFLLFFVAFPIFMRATGVGRGRGWGGAVFIPGGFGAGHGSRGGFGGFSGGGFGGGFGGGGGGGFSGGGSSGSW